MDVLPIVRVISAFCATETPVKVTDPALPLQFTVPEAAPEPVVTGTEIPLPAPAATKFPALAVTLPVVAVTPVPPVTVVNADTEPADEDMFPRVATILPAEAVTPPVVAIKPVPAVTVVPPARVVVVLKEPGATIAAGKETVAMPPEVLTVIWLVVPTTLCTGPSASAI